MQSITRGLAMLAFAAAATIALAPKSELRAQGGTNCGAGLFQLCATTSVCTGSYVNGYCTQWTTSYTYYKKIIIPN